MENILHYLDNPQLPVVILVVVISFIIYLLRREKTQHRHTRERLDDVYGRIEQRLYHELDELEKLLREERAKLK